MTDLDFFKVAEERINNLTHKEFAVEDLPTIDGYRASTLDTFNGDVVVVFSSTTDDCHFTYKPEHIKDIKSKGGDELLKRLLRERHERFIRNGKLPY